MSEKWQRVIAVCRMECRKEGKHGKTDDESGFIDCSNKKLQKIE